MGKGGKGRGRIDDEITKPYDGGDDWGFLPPVRSNAVIKVIIMCLYFPNVVPMILLSTGREDF